MSTDEQSSLDHFQTAAELRDEDQSEDGDERPNWEPYDPGQPDTGAQEKCNNCGSLVTSHFARVFTQDGKVDACPDCATYREISGNTDHIGSGAGLGGGL